ncbi:MAG: hypothetical protein HFJ42_05900 [Clostridia bacterium]|nr:hypothetical protein [Clostridia bacterium]
MPIIYGVSIIILFTLTILLKKTEEKLEIIKAVTINFVLLFAYNTFVCYILNLINIPITLIILSVINFAISIPLIISIIKTKKIQEYTVSKTNIAVMILFIIITTIIININFGNLTKIRYVSMDSREHYKAGREFSEITNLFKKTGPNITTHSGFMPGAYTNVGIIFKILNPYIGTVELYKAYIIFEAFVYLLIGIVFYMLLEKYCKNINTKIIAIIFGIIYVLGYPLNAWISGFHYLMLGILYVETILYIVKEREDINLDSTLITTFLLNFGLILSYSLFCPFVYFAQFIYYIYKYKKHKNKIKLFLQTLVTLILPGIIGVTYLIVPSIGKVGGYIALEGWLYKNLWSNFIFFMPFTIYYIYTNIKNRKLEFDNIMFALLFIFILVLFIGTKTGKCSEYYFYKNYFIFWILIIYSSTKGMIELLKENKTKFIVNIYTIIYLVIFAVAMYHNKTYVTSKRNDSLNTTMEIFTFNKTMIIAKEAEFMKQKELELLKEMENIIEDNWQRENDILLITNPNEERWIQSLTGYINVLYDDKEYAIKNLEQENYKYIVTFESKITYENMEQYIKKENMKIIYQNQERKNI